MANRFSNLFNPFSYAKDIDSNDSERRDSMRSTEERKESRSARFEDPRLRRPKDSDLRPRRPAAPEKRRYDDSDEDDYDEPFRVKESSETRAPRPTVSSLPREVSPRPAKHAGETPRRTAPVSESESIPEPEPAPAPAPDPFARPASSVPPVARMASRTVVAPATPAPTARTPVSAPAPKNPFFFPVLPEDWDDETVRSGAPYIYRVYNCYGQPVEMRLMNAAEVPGPLMGRYHSELNRVAETKLRSCAPFWFEPNPSDPTDTDYMMDPLSLKKDKALLRRLRARTT